MNSTHVTAPKKSFKVQMLAARETAIIQSVNRLLAEKGFDAMTVDEVAAEVGIAKASLYKHFTSKEELACAAMVTAMRRAQEVIQSTDPQQAPLDKIKAVTRWTMTLKLQGLMPSLPSQNSTLRATLMASKDYMDGLMEVSDALGGWIEEAQAQGQINKALPAVAVLYTLFARACDPVLEFLKMGEQHTDEQILDLVMSTCFEGLNAR
ncbi:TetR/AcrR family transcriptional regulator [Limnohabitans sp. Bal53]|jgi:TetR/AcrR family transcriptional regulator, regulator of autoinduction and epiphytic fitness|uniref:TetR/AcrR family transcriptional regulator n=1 Tax=Limnohabitans sp. Bal53 TaxID=1977910 RepID=UPI000D35811F|nr:TetR/AcrR family transcriptional regulator [Limnohabitans sp. Bal53]PUE39337.1 TetR family transcriptional regulator [Limnohabitans sp. Bal53]